MKMSLTKRSFFVQLAILTLVLGWLGAGILRYVLPGLYFEGYPCIPVYFFLFGIFEISMFDACRRYDSKRLVIFYLAIKIIKIILSTFFAIIYCIAVREEVKAFLLTFIVYYMIYLVHDTWFFSNYEKAKGKQHKKKENETNA